MSLTEKQIKVLYEESGMTPAEIAADLGLSVEAVCLALKQSSAMYRKLVKSEVETPVAATDELAEEMLDIIVNIARTQQSDNPGVAKKAAELVLDIRSGRADARAGINSKKGNINVLVFNETLERSRRVISQMKEAMGLAGSGNQKMIDVVEEKQSSPGSPVVA